MIFPPFSGNLRRTGTAPSLDTNRILLSISGRIRIIASIFESICEERRRWLLGLRYPFHRFVLEVLEIFKGQKGR